MGKNGKKLLALLLAIMMVFTVCSPTSGGSGVGTTSAEGSTEAVATSTDANSKARLLGSSGASLLDDDGLTVSDFTIKVNGETVTNDASVTNGDTVEISFKWYITNNSGISQFSVNLNAMGININDYSDEDLNRSGEKVGTFSISNGVLTINLDENVTSESSISGTANIKGVVSFDASDLNNDNRATISIGGTSYTVVVDLNEDESSAWMSKAATGSATIASDGSSITQSYTITIGANTNTVTLKNLTDVVSQGDASSYSMSNISYGGKTYSSWSDLVTALSGTTLDANNTITITYNVTYNFDSIEAAEGAINSSSTYKNSAELTYTTNKGEEKTSSANANISVTAPSVSKSGTLNDNGTITWTITVNAGDLTDIEDWLNSTSSVYVSDTLGSGQTYSGNLNLSYLTLADFSDNGNGVYTLTYTTTVDSKVLNSTYDTSVTNDVTVTFTDDISKATTGRVGIAGSVDYLDKEFVSLDSNGIFTWKITVNVPDSGMTSVNISDSEWSTLDFSTTTVTVNGTTIIENGSFLSNISNIVDTTSDWTYGVSSSGFYFILSDSYVENYKGQTIEITVTSTAKSSYPLANGNTYTNNVKLECTVDGQSYSETASASHTYTNNIDKSGEASSTNSTVINYTLDVDVTALYNEGIISDSNKTFTITDTLDENLTYNKDGEVSYVYWYNSYSRWTGIEAATIENVSYDETTNKIIFTITLSDTVINNIKNIIETNTDNGYSYKYLAEVAYSATVADSYLTEFATNGTSVDFTNTASLDDGSFATDTTALTPSDVTSKSGYYNTGAMLVTYTIEVNPDAADLLDDEDWITATDTLTGNDLTIKPDTVVVQAYDKNAETWTTLTAGTDYSYTYDSDSKTLTFTIPDATYLIITYDAKVNANIGTVANASNSFALSGVTGNSMSVSDAFSSMVQRPTVTVDSENMSVTLYKYWTNGNNMEATGATFGLYAVTVNSSGNITEEEAVNGYESFKVNNKTVISGLVKDQIYVLKEISVDEGFSKGDDYYFVLLGEGDTAANVNYPTGVTVDTQFYYGYIYYENEKTDSSATIKIDKTYTTGTNVKDVSFGIYYAGTASDYDVVIDGNYYKEYTIVAMDDADFTNGNYVASSTVDTSVAGAYYVYELDANGDPITDSSEVFTLDSSGTYYTVSASGNAITSLSTGDEVTAYFTNTEVADTSISLSAKKTLSGGTLTDGMFKFILSDDGSSALQTVTNSGTDVTFAGIDYTADDIGTYTYYIYEQDDSVTNFAYKYDTTCYKVIVTVALNSAGNGLTTTIAVRKYDTLDYAIADTNNTDNTNGSDVQTAKTETSFSSMSFTNTAAASLKVSKVLDGSAASTSDKFDFTITLSDDTINETYSATGAVSSVEFTNGVATVTLKGGQYVNIEGLPAGITYSVVEADYSDDGYSTVCTEGSASGTLTAGNTSSVTYTNIKTAGNLEITKTVAGDGAGADTTEFDFTVTITDLAGKTVTATKTGASGSTDINVEFNSNGVAIVTLMNGESLMFSDLPAGTEYSVKEDDYTSDGYLTTLSGDETGAIEDGKTSTVAYTNKIIDKATLTVTKNLAGNDYSAYLDEEFEITIYLEIGSSSAILDTLATAYDAVKNDTETTVSFTKDTADSRVYATIKLKGSDSLTIYDIPVGAKYTVSEADYTGTGYNFDSPKFTYIDENYGTISDDYASSVTITNTRNTYGNLTVSKAIDGNSQDATKEFAFTVVLSDKTINGSYGEMTFTNGIATFTLKGGDSITAEGLPNGVTYTVTESDYVLDGYQTTVSINSAAAVATNVAEGTIVGSATETVTQTVAYTNTKDTYSTLTINKEIAGNDADSNQEFEFEITLSDNSTATYTATGGVYTSVSFTSGTATVKLKGGEYVTITGLPSGTTYTVTEKTAAGYVTKVTKTTGMVDGTNSAKVSGTISDTTPQSVTYTNTKNTYGDLTISKTVAGNAGSTSDEFEFTIKLSGTTDSSVLNGTYSATSVGASYTKVTFSNGSATITLKDGESVTITGIPNGVTYTVTEEDYAVDGYVTTVSTDASGSTYDAGNTVTDTVDGTVGSNTQYYALFKNTNNKQSLTVSKIVSGNDTSEDDYFAFVITITNENGAPLSGTYSGVEFDSDGKATVYLSGGDSLEIELPEGTKYTVVEQTGVYVIDGSEYVEDTTAAAYNLEDVSGTGTTSLADASASGEIEAGTAATAVYTNTRDSFGNLVISKTVSSGDTSKVFAFTIELSDSTVSGYYDCTYTDGEGIETSDVVLFTAGVATVELADGESVTIENLPNGVSYEVTEDDYSQDGYVIASEINSSNTIKGNDTREVIFVNKLTSVSISKVDIADGSELPGATIQIIDSNGNVVEEWVSTNEAHEVIGLIPGETYTLRETVAPDGYGIATDTTFVLDKYGNIDTTQTTTTISSDGVLLVEDWLIETSTTTTTTTTTTTSTTTTSTPDTGDNTPIVPIAVLFGASVAGIFMTLLVKNKEKKRNRR